MDREADRSGGSRGNARKQDNAFGYGKGFQRRNQKPVVRHARQGRPHSRGTGETDLSAAAAFSFKRVGGQAATGDLSKFGLKWPENVLAATNVSLQKDGASKFVELAAADWSNITTQEALKEAIDKASDMKAYTGISADKGQDYDVVLGVINEDVYYMLHITKATVATDATVGTTIEITGQYKH